jgi:hypothetical protein
LGRRSDKPIKVTNIFVLETELLKKSPCCAEGVWSLVSCLGVRFDFIFILVFEIFYKILN